VVRDLHVDTARLEDSAAGPGPPPVWRTGSSCGSVRRLDTLRALPPAGDIDLVFIDADKPGYAAYWAELVPRVRRGGLLLADNVLWSGEIIDPEVIEANVIALRLQRGRAMTPEPAAT
jgi:predicted O-methyltransferase YrrM